jgi:hypothetical protein
MTRKHFEAAALLASDLPIFETRRAVADAFVHLFGKFAPRFDAARFYTKVEKLASEREKRERA